MDLTTTLLCFIYIIKNNRDDVLMKIIMPDFTVIVWKRSHYLTSYQRHFKQILLNYSPRTKYEGRYCFHRCLSVNISGGSNPS